MQKNSPLKIFLFASVFLIGYLGNAQTVDSLQNAILKEKDPVKKTSLFNSLCDLQEGKELKATIDQFKSFAESCKLENSLAGAWENLGYYFYSIQKFDTSIACYQKSLLFYKKTGNKKKISRCFNEIGVDYYYKGNLEKALENYLEDLKILDELNDQNSVIKSQLNLGMIYDRQMKFDEALKCFEKGKKICEQLNDTVSLITVENNIGYTYNNKKNLLEAEKHYRKAFSLIHDKNSQLYINVIGNLGSNLVFQKKAQEGLPYLEECVKILRKSGNEAHLSICLTNLGNAYTQTGNPKKGIPIALEGYELSIKNNLLDNSDRISLVLADLYNQSADYKNAGKFYRIYIRLHDSLLREKSTVSMNKMEVLYETQKKDLELIKKTKNIEEQQLEIQKSQIESEKKKKYIFLLAGGISLLTITALFIFRAYRSKKKNNQYLSKLNEEISASREEIMRQKELIEQKQKEVLDSIHYARRIQRSLLPSEKFIARVLKKNQKEVKD